MIDLFKRAVNHASTVLYEYFRIKQYHILRKLINDNGYKRIAEVGLYAGTTARYLLKHCPSIKKYHGIDKYNAEMYKGVTKVMYSGLDPETLAKCKAKAYSIRDRRFSIIDDYSTNASKRFKDGELDLVFIDADHTYKATKADIEAWLPKVRSGGMLVGHDYSLEFFPVIRAVEDTIGSDNIILFKGYGTWVHKKKSGTKLHSKSKE
jgi:predicted O-methyltransferase YrrM